MGRRLAAAVHVQHPKTHDWLILQPGDEPDEDLAEVITNPDAWQDEDEDEPSDADTAQEPEGDDPGSDPAPEPQREPEPVKPARTRASRKAAEEQ